MATHCQMTFCRWHQSEWCSWHARSWCHPEWPGQAGEVGLREPYEVQSSQVQGPAPGSGQSPVSMQAGGWRDWEQPSQEGLGGTGGWKAGHKPTMCTRSPKGQLYPELHQECGQQVEGSDSAPLLWSGETPSGVLCPALEPSAQERHGTVGAGPEEGHKDAQRDGTPLVWGKAERVGAVQPGEERAVGRP